MTNKIAISIHFTIKRFGFFIFLIVSLIFTSLYDYYLNISEELEISTELFDQEIKRFVVRNSRIQNQAQELYQDIFTYNDPQYTNDLKKIKLNESYVVDMKNSLKGVSFGSKLNPSGERANEGYFHEAKFSLQVQEIFQSLFESDGSIATLFYFGNKFNISSIFSISDLNGINSLNTARLVAGAMNHARKKYYPFIEKHLNNNLDGVQFYWTNPYHDEVGNGMLITLVSPIYIDKKFHAFIGADITLNYLKDKILNPLREKTNADAQILFEDQLIINSSFKYNLKENIDLSRFEKNKLTHGAIKLEKSIVSLDGVSTNGTFKLQIFVNLLDLFQKNILFVFLILVLSFCSSFFKVKTK